MCSRYLRCRNTFEKSNAVERSGSKFQPDEYVLHVGHANSAFGSHSQISKPKNPRGHISINNMDVLSASEHSVGALQTGSSSHHVHPIGFIVPQSNCETCDLSTSATFIIRQIRISIPIYHILSVCLCSAYLPISRR